MKVNQASSLKKPAILCNEHTFVNKTSYGKIHKSQ